MHTFKDRKKGGEYSGRLYQKRISVSSAIPQVTDNFVQRSG
jgi:hypothetical protein